MPRTNMTYFSRLQKNILNFSMAIEGWLILPAFRFLVNTSTTKPQEVMNIPSLFFYMYSTPR